MCLKLSCLRVEESGLKDEIETLECVLERVTLERNKWRDLAQAQMDALDRFGEENARLRQLLAEGRKNENAT